jgi:hypothetical protein
MENLSVTEDNKAPKLRELLDDLSRAVTGMTRNEAVEQNICIACKQPPRFKTELGRKEFFISGMCEYCFDELFADEAEEKPEGY